MIGLTRSLPRSVAAALQHLRQEPRRSQHSDRRRLAGRRRPSLAPAPGLELISSRRAWESFWSATREHKGGEDPWLISVNWPGFLADVVRDCCPAGCGVIAAERHGVAFREWLLVAPTWRGPFPTTVHRQSRAFPLIRSLVEAPLLGPLLYRLSTTGAMPGWMSRRHVDLAGPRLTPEAGRNRPLEEDRHRLHRMQRLEQLIRANSSPAAASPARHGPANAC